MNTGLQVDGVSYLPLREAARLVSYTRDYVARLAREEKISATRVGRQWYVDPVSLLHFAEQAEIESAVRREQLSVIRQRERETQAQLAHQQTVRATQLHHASRTAIAFTVMVCICAVLVGVSVHQTGLVLGLMPSWATQVADTRILQSFTEVSPPARVVSGDDGTVIHDTRAGLVTIAPLQAADSFGVLLLPRDGHVVTAADVAELFSDPIHIERADDGVSYIRLGTGSDESGLSVVFLPIANEGNSE